MTKAKVLLLLLLLLLLFFYVDSATYFYFLFDGYANVAKGTTFCGLQAN